MQLFPNSGVIRLAQLLRDELELAKLRLFKSTFNQLGTDTTRAALVAAECTFTGYPAGGVVIAAMLSPLLNPAGGVSIDWPTVQFEAAAPYTVAEVVGGWWLETAGGVLVAAGTFPDGIPVGQAGQGFPLSGSLVLPNGG